MRPKLAPTAVSVEAPPKGNRVAAAVRARPSAERGLTATAWPSLPAGHAPLAHAIAPGPVDTDMMSKNPQQAIDYMVNGTLMKRLAQPDEMIGAALLLCSAAGSYITGTVVIVDGGGTPR